MCDSCHDGHNSAEHFFDILDSIDVGRKLGLITRAEDPNTNAWIMARERDLRRELEPVTEEIGQESLDKISKVIDDTDWATISVQAASIPIAIMAQTIDSSSIALATKAGPVVGNHGAKVYEDSRKLFVPDVSFDLVDKEAIAFAESNAPRWIRHHYGPALSDKISKQTINALEKGLGREALANSLKVTLESEYLNYGAYWDTLSSAELVRNRSFSSIKTMSDQGIERFTSVSIGDERRCERCGSLDGTIFSVPVAMTRMTNTIKNASTMQHFQDSYPWIGQRGSAEKGNLEFYTKSYAGVETDLTSAIGSMSIGSPDDGATIQNLGALVPWHGRCRCLLISVD